VSGVDSGRVLGFTLALTGDGSNAESRLADGPAVLFTAFEPSGDDHAALVIAELKRRRPDLNIAAWGGLKMERAGARLIERTGDDAVVGLPGPAKIRAHQRLNGRIARWMDEHPVALHVPVDSPAANFPICKAAKRRGVPVVHLVAPQLWAWGAWRVRKLRRLTDHVLCLLPFEQAWFVERGVPATFIGHPLFDEPIETEDLAGVLDDVPDGEPKLAVLPGSRPAEIKSNFPILLEAFVALRRRHPDAVGVVAATTSEVEARLREMAEELGGWPRGLTSVAGRTDSVVRWCDLALAVSGTVTLQVARQHKPMVIFYKANPVMYALLGWWIIDTELFALPNLIAGREIVPELIPHFGDAQAIIDSADRLLGSPEQLEAQRTELERVTDLFSDSSAGAGAADAIERVLDEGVAAMRESRLSST